MDLAKQKGGEEKLKFHLSAERLEKVQKWVKQP